MSASKESSKASYSFIWKFNSSQCQEMLLYIYPKILRNPFSFIAASEDNRQSVMHFFFSFWDFIYLFLEIGEGREKERERNISVWLPLKSPLLGTWPASQACTLTGNQTKNSLLHSPALSPLSHTSQDYTQWIWITLADTCFTIQVQSYHRLKASSCMLSWVIVSAETIRVC